MEDKNKIKTILIFLIVILVIVTISVIGIKEDLLTKLAKKNYGYEIMGVYKDSSVEVEKTLAFEGITVLQKLKGQLPVSTATSSIKKIFIEEIPKVFEECKDYDELKLKEYYNSNYNKIKSDLKIDTEESFVNMITKIKEINCNLQNDYDKCAFYEEEERIFVKFSYTNSQVIELYIKGNDAITFKLEF